MDGGDVCCEIARSKTGYLQVETQAHSLSLATVTDYQQ
jgi:hypothetical protein